MTEERNKAMNRVMNILVTGGILIGSIVFVWWKYPLLLATVPSDSRSGEHPQLLGVRLNDKIASQNDLPDGIKLIDISKNSYLYPDRVFNVVSSFNVISGVNRCAISVSTFDDRVVSIQISKNYTGRDVDAVKADFQKLCEFVDQNYEGPAEFIDNKTHWEKDWNLGYEQKATVGFGGFNGYGEGRLYLSITDIGKLNALCKASRLRGLSEL